MKFALKKFSHYLKDLTKNNLMNSVNYLNNKTKIHPFIEKYTKQILDKSPDIIGFSICYKDQLAHSLTMAKLIKKTNPSIPIVFGGALFDKTKNNASFLKTHQKIIDYIIYNQGEFGLLGLVKQYKKSNIPNLVYLDKKTIKINNEKIITNYENHPFADFSDFDLNNYFVPSTVLPIISANGCYWSKCSFCNNCNKKVNKYISKLPKKFVEELKHYNTKFNTNYFFFADEMISAPRFEKIAKEIIKQKLKINYAALVKPSEQFTFNILKKMRASGCILLFTGIESGNQRILNLMNKGTTVENNKEFLKRVSIADIKNACFIILGFPTETKKELEDTKNFFIKNKRFVDFVCQGTFVLKNRSDIKKNPKKYNIKIKKPQQSTKLTIINDFEVLGEDAIQPDSEIYQEYLTFFRNFKNGQYGLGKFREHMLIYFSQKNKQKYSKNQNFFSR